MSQRSGSRGAVATLIVLFLVVAGWTAWRAVQPGGDGGVLSPAGPEAPATGFVGTGACASCHREEHGAWEESHHDLAMQEAGPGAVLGDFDDARFTDGDVTSTFSRRNDRFFVSTDGPDGTLQDFEVAYTYGVEPLQQYLIELSGGRVQPLSIAWDSRPAADGGQRWFHLYSGQGIEAPDPLHWTGREQNWNYMCADCHSTNVRKGYDVDTDRFETTWSEIDVGCEACHGPGARHVEWADASPLTRSLFWDDNDLTAPLTERQGVSWTVDASSGRPERSVPRTTDAEIATCAQCHSRRAQIADGYTAGASFDDFYAVQPLVEGLYHPDGQQRDEVYVYGSFLQSRMYDAGVTCSDCHDPHSQQVRAPGNQLCATCHAAAAYDTPSHHFHTAASAGAQCVSCHMPETTYMVVDPRRDHSFRVPRPDQSVTLGVPNACNGCHTEQTPAWAADALRGWNGGDPEGFQRFADVFSAAEQDAPGASAALRGLAADPSESAIVRASALARLRDGPAADAVAAARVGLGDPDPMIRRSALLVLDQLPVQERAALAAPLLADPSRGVRIQAARLLAPATRLLTEAGREAFARTSEEFVASQRYNADRVESRLTLGAFFAELGRVDEADAEYRAAIQLARDFAPAYVNLADLIRLQGREVEAELTLREGLAVAPDDPTLHHALGLSHVRSGDLAQAIEELGRAAALGPEQPALAYAYAVALNSTGRVGDAIETLEEARLLHPRDGDLLFALATFHRDAGEMEAAVGYAQLLSEFFPDDPQAGALLQSLR